MRRVLLLSLLLLSGCAWSNRANRPVWNAFEAHLVPEGDGAFYATLPLTVPAGLVAILADTFIVHPAQVVDDAADDVVDLWDDVPWADEYYSQLGLLPFRAVATPLVFLGSFLWRSCIDIEGLLAPAADDVEDRESRLLAALDEIAGGGALSDELVLIVTPPPWSAGLQAAFDRALAGGRAPERLDLVRFARRHALPPVLADPALGLRDPDPVVRHAVLENLKQPRLVPADVIAQLRDDPSEMVRIRARALWP